MDEKIKRQLDKVRTYYNEKGGKKGFNALVVGDFGSGKTSLLRTCRAPILVDSFDPGGTKTVKKEIDEGIIIPDVRFEDEDPKQPKAFSLWDEEYHAKKRSGIFDELGTYCIDSATTWGQTAMNAILKKKGRPGEFPQQDDYGPQMALLETAIRDITSLPCDCILTAHPDLTKDETTGKMFVSMIITGKLRTRVPILFDEIYFTVAREKAKETTYELLTQTDGLFKARTRIGSWGVFEKYEKPDIKYLLKKAGYPHEDKPLI